MPRADESWQVQAPCVGMGRVFWRVSRQLVGACTMCVHMGWSCCQLALLPIVLRKPCPRFTAKCEA